MADLLEGYDAEGYEDFCDEVYNNVKNHWRQSDPCVNLAGIQPGMIVSDEDDDKLYHYGSGSAPCEEVLQVTRSADRTPHFYSVDLGIRAIMTDTRARAYLSANQLNLVSAAWTKILIDTINYDTGDDFSAAYGTFVTPVAGWYELIGQVLWVGSSVVADKIYYTAIYVDGASVISTPVHSSHQGIIGACSKTIEYIAAGIDVELYAMQNTGVNTPDVLGGSQYTFLCVHLLSI